PTPALLGFQYRLPPHPTDPQSTTAHWAACILAPYHCCSGVTPPAVAACLPMLHYRLQRRCRYCHIRVKLMPGTRLTRLAISVTITVSAFLLFQVQPIVAKALLPWFGGVPAVWTVCMLFFQGLLLAGYVYAHILVTSLPLRWQVLVHTLLLLGSLYALPLLPEAHWPSQGRGDPTWPLITHLFSMIGVPYFLLACTAPLLQGWFARGALGASPYWLYAVSNASALLALVTYPVVVEPVLPQRTQSIVWSVGYGVFALWAGLSVRRVTRASADAITHPTPGTGETAPTLDAYGRWFAWPFTASVLLLAVTNTLCQDTAVIPFLWVVPLSLYLLTYILCFSSPWWY